MRIWTWIKGVFGRNSDKGITPADSPIHPDNVNHNDEMMRQAIAHCFNTGKTVHGERNPDGTMTLKEWD